MMGLAEYSNANYFSWDTIGDQRYQHPMQAIERYANGQPRFNQSTEGGLYLYATTSDGRSVQHLAKFDLLAWLFTPAALRPQGEAPYFLDSLCYADYAADLIPKAKQYAAALASYFFRGSMACVKRAESDGSYKLLIMNSSAERMGGGTVTVGRLDGEILMTIPPEDVGAIEPQSWSEPIDISDLIGEVHANHLKPFYVVYRGELGNPPAVETEAVVVYDSPLPSISEHWTPSEGMVFRGSSGTIQGDLGVWKYKSVEYPSHASCDPRIVIENGVLTVHECHGRECVGGMGCPEYFGEGSYRVWLEQFDQGQERMPLEHLEWTCTPASGDLGDQGHSNCYLGLKNGGLRDDNPGELTLDDDYLCLRGLAGGGSLYFGLTLYNNSAANPTNEATMSLSGIRLAPTDTPYPYPVEEATTLTETWRGVTGDYRPLPTGLVYRQGEVRVPGDLGTWVFYVEGVQNNLDPCDTRVHVEDGIAAIYECHHKFPSGGGEYWSEGGWRFYMPEPYGDLTKTPLSSIQWTGTVEGDLGTGGGTGSELGLKNRLITQLGPISAENLFLSPPDKLKVLSDGYVSLASLFALYSYAVGATETYTTTTQIQDMRLEIYDPEQGGGPAPGPGSTRLPLPTAVQGFGTPPAVAPGVSEQARELERESMRTYGLIDFSQPD